jgi:hypothetical protein
MSGSLKDNEVADLIENLNEVNPEHLNDSLQSLIIAFQADRGQEIVYHFSTLFPRLETLLTDENLSVVVQASQLLLEAVTNFAREAEPYFYHVVGKLVVNLGDSRVRDIIPIRLTCIARCQENGLEQSDPIPQVNQEFRARIFLSSQNGSGTRKCNRLSS